MKICSSMRCIPHTSSLEQRILFRLCAFACFIFFLLIPSGVLLFIKINWCACFLTININANIVILLVGDDAKTVCCVGLNWLNSNRLDSAQTGSNLCEPDLQNAWPFYFAHSGQQPSSFVIFMRILTISMHIPYPQQLRYLCLLFNHIR